jgi:hypothetical protein
MATIPFAWSSSRLIAFAPDHYLRPSYARLEALGEKAAQAGQFSAAIAAEIKRGEAVGLYIKRTEDVTKLTSEQREERVMALLKRRGLRLVGVA